MSPEPSPTNAQLALRQIQSTREYTTRLLADVQDDEWFQMPGAGVTHLAWQMGHLAMAQYGLTLMRIRGKEPSDADVISKDFMRCFLRGTTPDADAMKYPQPAEIRKVFDDVFALAIETIPTYTDETLAESLPMPTFVHENKLGSLLFCSAHEMLHAGQIGLLRRQLGKPPLG